MRKSVKTMDEVKVSMGKVAGGVFWRKIAVFEWFLVKKHDFCTTLTS